MYVQDILDVKGTHVYTAKPTELISDVAALLDARRVGAVLIVEDAGRAVGIISERDIVRGLAESGEAVLREPVYRLMVHNLHWCRPRSTLKEIMTLMTRRRLRHLPVQEDGQIRGIISIGDVVKHRLREMETEAGVLRDCLAVSRASHVH